MIRSIRLSAHWVGVFLTVLVAAACSKSPEQLLASAEKHLASEDYKAAIIELKNALSEQPELARGRYMLGRALLATGDSPSAEKELRLALKYQFPEAQVIPPLAKALVDQQQYDKVLTEFGNKKVGDPEGDAELLSSVGSAQLQKGAMDKAEAAFQQALKLKPGYVRAELGMAQLSAAKGDLQTALGITEAVLAKQPQEVSAMMLRGALFVAQRKTTEALQLYERAAAVAPDNLAARFASVSLLIGSNRMDEAGKRLDELRQRAPKHPQTQYLSALVAQRKGDLPAARDAILQVLRVAPDHVPSLALAGSIEYSLRSFPTAEQYLAKALSRAPEAEFVRRLLVATYLQEGRTERAREAFAPFRATADRDPALATLAGEIALQGREFAEAETWFTKAAAAQPNDSRPKTRLALTHLSKGNVDVALKELEAISASDPKQYQSDIALILNEIRRKNYDRALTAIARLESKQPNNPATFSMKGTALVGKKDVPAARQAFEQALRLQPTYFPAALNLAWLDLADNKPADANRRFERMLEADPKNVFALLTLAEFKATQGAKPSEVIDLVARAKTANPQAPETHTALIRAHLANRDAKQALVVAQEADRIVPNNPDIMNMLASAQMAAGEQNQAVATLGKLAASQPDSPEAALKLARAQASTGDRAAAIVTFSKLTERFPKYIVGKRDLVALYLAGNQFQEAQAVARDIQKQPNARLIGLQIEADVLTAQRKWPEAIARLKEAEKLGKQPETTTRLLAALSGSGQSKEAEQVLNVWLKDNPKDPIVRNYAAERALAEKRYAQAVDHYRALTQLQPKNALMLNNLAWSAFMAKDSRALEWAEAAHKTAPTSPPILDTLANILLESGQTKRGLELMEQAVKIAPTNPGIRLNYAKALIKTGDKGKARKELETLSVLGDRYPQREEVASLLKAL